MSDSLAWHSAAKRYLERLGLAEWHAQNRPMGGRHRYSRQFYPSAYHSALIECLNRNDEEGFKALKARVGYAEALGV
jgi:hypothetical protein